MARILNTAVVADIRGKIAGTVFGRNKGGAIARTKVSPVNPKTAAQSRQRAYLSDLSKAWGGLTDAQRAGWKSYGQVIGATNVFGNNLILSGIATYQRINLILLTAGAARVDTAPTNQIVPSIVSASLVANHVGGLLTLSFTPTPLTGTQGLYIFATPASPVGVSNLSNKLRFIGFSATAASPLALQTEWGVVFGSFPVVAGQRIAITAAVVDTATGAISAAYGTSTVVV